MQINLKPKQVFRRNFRKIGLDIQKITDNSYFQLLKSFSHFNINNVFDIGANTGQFADELRWFGYNAKIISFEPTSQAHKILTKAASNDPLWKVHERVALGNFEGETEINLASNSLSSSLLPMLDLHERLANNSNYIGREKVLIKCLDTISSQYLSPSDNLFIKIDVQGSEWEVLDGSYNTLKRAKGILCELSLVPLYEGGHLWTDILNRLQLAGFTLWGLDKGFSDPGQGRTLQIDAVLFRV
jgi:FkbM family methyltransferase